MRVGIIGCGTIAQVMHIPYVAELPEAELYALSDPATDRVEELARKYDVPFEFGQTENLVAEIGSDLDAAIILTPPHTHADNVSLTLDADIHTLVEKPISVDPADADRMVEAAEASEASAMVAYMKRYDPAYEQALETLPATEDIDLVTAYDVDPNHGRIIDEIYDIVPGTVSEEFIQESIAERHDDALTAIGGDDDGLADDYDWHLEHICHDVNALRGLFGDVETIDHVDVFSDGRYATAHLQYEGDVRCTLDSGLSDRKWFEEFIRVDHPSGMLEIDFSNPFIKNTPTELRVKEGTEDVSDAVYTPSYEESFKREIRHFIEATQGNAEIRTSFAEARNDVYLIADMFRTYRGANLLGGV